MSKVQVQGTTSTDVDDEVKVDLILPKGIYLLQTCDNKYTMSCSKAFLVRVPLNYSNSDMM